MATHLSGHSQIRLYERTGPSPSDGRAWGCGAPGALSGMGSERRHAGAGGTRGSRIRPHRLAQLPVPPPALHASPAGPAGPARWLTRAGPPSLPVPPVPPVMTVPSGPHTSAASTQLARRALPCDGVPWPWRQDGGLPAPAPHVPGPPPAPGTRPVPGPHQARTRPAPAEYHPLCHGP
jgi:hypothetical protein